MTLGMKTLICPVTDLAAATRFYSTLLGVEPAFQQANYVGFMVGDMQVGLDPSGKGRGMTGPVPFWDVDDATKAFDTLVAAGAEAIQPPTNVGGGKLIAMVRDPDGSLLGLSQPPAG
jgi:predicted enzyme related to lactoylglutathione lyase